MVNEGKWNYTPHDEVEKLKKELKEIMDYKELLKAYIKLVIAQTDSDHLTLHAISKLPKDQMIELIKISDTLDD